MKSTTLNRVNNFAESVPGRQLDMLLSIILDAAMRLSRCRAGTVYNREGETLRFRIVRNLDKPELEQATDAFPPVPMGSRANLCTLAAAEGKTLHIPDAYAPGTYDLSGLHSYDNRTGYRSHSVLVCPIMYQAECMAVLQLINARSADGSECDFTQALAQVEKLAESVADALPIFRLLSERDRLAPPSAMSERQRRYLEENYYGTLSPLEVQNAAEQNLIRAETVRSKQARMEADKLAVVKQNAFTCSRPPYETLNDYINAAKAAHGKKKLHLSEEANIDKSTLSRLRHGQIRMSQKYLYAIIVALGLSYGEAEGLMGAYGMRFSGNNQLDMIIEEYLKSLAKGGKKYSVTEINIDLQENGIALLGSRLPEDER